MVRVPKMFNDRRH